MPQLVTYRFWMENYRQPKYEYWEDLIHMGQDVVGSYLISDRSDIIKEMCLNLPDKNGIMVHENDLVLGPVVYKNQQGEQITKEELQVIVWFQAGFYFNPITSSTYYPVTQQLLKQVRVVGNTHQLVQEEILLN